MSCPVNWWITLPTYFRRKNKKALVSKSKIKFKNFLVGISLKANHFPPFICYISCAKKMFSVM